MCSRQLEAVDLAQAGMRLVWMTLQLLPPSDERSRIVREIASAVARAVELAKRGNQ